MKNNEMKTPASIQTVMIAPCGMNCALCIGHLRERKPCPGCNDSRDANKPMHCVVCAIKFCEEMSAFDQKFCFECAKFPCARLKQLDNRYRSKYGMSMIENLKHIQADGLAQFVLSEQERWTCPQCGGVVCVHREGCIYCGLLRSQITKDRQTFNEL